MDSNITRNERLLKQIEFIVEIDKTKQIFRQNVVTGTERNENDAEHSWHMAVMAILLSEYSAMKDIDSLKVIKLALVHDLVEIYAGDTYCYDEKGYEDKPEREKKSADRLFGMLPADQAKEFYDMWREFEEMASPEARFAACLDRIQPLLLNYCTKGHTWQRPEANSEKVFKRNAMLKENMPELWELAQNIINDSIKKGYLKP